MRLGRGAIIATMPLRTSGSPFTSTICGIARGATVIRHPIAPIRPESGSRSTG